MGRRRYRSGGKPSAFASSRSGTGPSRTPGYVPATIPSHDLTPRRHSGSIGTSGPSPAPRPTSGAQDLRSDSEREPLALRLTSGRRAPTFDIPFRSSDPRALDPLTTERQAAFSEPPVKLMRRFLPFPEPTATSNPACAV